MYLHLTSGSVLCSQSRTDNHTALFSWLLNYFLFFVFLECVLTLQLVLRYTRNIANISRLKSRKRSGFVLPTCQFVYFTNVLCFLSLPVKQCMPCPDGWRHIKDKCYFFSDDKLDWIRSKQSCATMDSQLTILHTHEQHVRICVCIFLYKSASDSDTLLIRIEWRNKNK